jgi:hypothetical protein
LVTGSQLALDLKRGLRGGLGDDATEVTARAGIERLAIEFVRGAIDGASALRSRGRPRCVRAR